MGPSPVNVGLKLDIQYSWQELMNTSMIYASKFTIVSSIFGFLVGGQSGIMSTHPPHFCKLSPSTLPVFFLSLSLFKKLCCLCSWMYG